MRKVQTRLTFAPNANSPSQASSAISPTPARIVYQDPRHPKKKSQQQQQQHPSSSASAAKNDVPSSSARSIPYFSDDEDIFADGKKFAVVLPSPSRAAAGGKAGGSRSFMGAKSSLVKQRGRPKMRAVEESDSSESEEEVREVTPKKKDGGTPIFVEDDGESGEEEEVPEPAETLEKPAPVSIESSESSDEDVVATPADKRRKRPAFLKDRSESPLQSPTRAVVRNGAVETPRKQREDSGSPSPKKAKKNTPIRNFIAGGYLDRARSPRFQRDPVKNEKPVSHKGKGKEVVDISSDEDGDSDDVVVEQDEDSDDFVVEQPEVRKKKTDSGGKEKALPSRKRRRSTSSEEDDEPVRSSPTKRRKQVLPSSSSSPAPQSRKSPQPATTKASRKGKGKDPSTRQTRQTNTPKKHRTEKQKTLELLKRRRAGEKIDELTESSSDDYQDERGAYDSDASHAALSVFDDEESSEGALEKVRQSLRPGNRNMDDDSFIVSDDDGPLGAPDSLHTIPLEFTHQAHKHLKSHFKDCVEWMVQKKINPAFNQHDAVYIQAFRKLEPEARGLAHSKFSSSAWKEGFVRALWGRPEFCEEELGPGEGEGRKCDACGRSGHPAKFRVRLEGNPYFQETLEDVEDSSSDDFDDDSASVNSKGQPLPPADTEFYLGRFCRANAERAHSLIHWKHALYSWVVQTLTEQGFLEGEKLAERVRWGERKLGALACEIVDEWTESGEVKGLWRDFKNNLEVARSSKQDRWNA